MGVLEFLRQKRNEKQVRKNLDNKLKKLKNNKEAYELKKIVGEENLRDDFFDIMFKIGYTKSREKRKQLIKKARKIAEKIPEFSGWPSSSKFWDVEAIAWIVNIPETVRDFIKKEINKTIPKGLNLSLGCGSFPYVRNSVLLDFSEEMLKSAGNSFKNKVVYDLNNSTLPFRSFSFDSVTMVFVANYIKDLKYLLTEVKRVLKQGGKTIIVQSAEPIAEFYRMKESKAWKPKDIEKIMKSLKFNTEVYETSIGRTNLIFFKGVK